ITVSPFLIKYFARQGDKGTRLAPLNYESLLANKEFDYIPIGLWNVHLVPRNNLKFEGHQSI
ncbi:MAG: hypothetical protein AAGK97_16495, partial [Bacteroidota bacterium]